MKNGEGWRDAWNFVDTALRLIENAEYLGNLRVIKEKGITFTWDDALLDYLVKKSYSMTYGARNLRRLIEKEIENPLATAIVTGDKPLMGAHLSAVDGEVKLDTI